MLILLSFTNRRKRRIRAAWTLGFVCAICLERLAVLHGSHGPAGDVERSAAVSAWVLNGLPPPVASALSPNHARFMPQRSSDDDSQGGQTSLRPGDVLAAELPADFPYGDH